MTGRTLAANAASCRCYFFFPFFTGVLLLAAVFVGVAFFFVAFPAIVPHSLSEPALPARFGQVSLVLHYASAMPKGLELSVFPALS